MIRKATNKDTTSISKIVCLCYEGFAQDDGWDSPVIEKVKKLRGSCDCINDLIANELVYVSTELNQVIGMVSIKDNEITKLYIHPAHQKKGIGAKLFKHAESVIQSQGFAKMCLVAAVKTPVPFYEKMGMTISEKRIVDHGPCIGLPVIIMEKYLKIQ